MRATPEVTALEKGIDCAVIVTNHRAFDYDRLLQHAPLVVDTRNALKGRSDDRIFRL
jgi:UDP-N-acetyl-D-glucosamine dehydrogenase